MSKQKLTIVLFLLLLLFYSVPLTSAEAYTINVLVYDSLGCPIIGADVSIVAGNFSYIEKTNSAGIASFPNVGHPGETIYVEIGWREKTIYYGSYQVSADPTWINLTLENVYPFVVQVKDPSGSAVSDSSILVTWTLGATFELEESTNKSGIAVFDQMIDLDCRIVIKYRGVIIYDESYSLSKDTSFLEITAPIYSLGIRVIDKNNVSIRNALVTLTCVDIGWSLQKSTNSEGYAKFTDLPKAIYKVEVSYMRRTARETLLLDSDLNRTYQLDIVTETTTSYPTVTITTITTTPSTTTSLSPTGSTTITSPPLSTPSPTEISLSPTPTKSPTITTSPPPQPKPPKKEEEFPITGLLIILGIMAYSFGISWVILKRS